MTGVRIGRRAKFYGLSPRDAVTDGANWRGTRFAAAIVPGPDTNP